MFYKILVLITVFHSYNCGKISNQIYKGFDERTLVTNNKLFPYVVAVLKRSTYLSAGALVHSEWVLTAADALYFMREASRYIRVRLGSINYRKGGIVLPIKFFEIHPSFNDQSPVFDIALIKLPYPVRSVPSLKPIRVPNKKELPDNRHFIVTSWPLPEAYANESENPQSMEIIKRRRTLSVIHLHPTDPEDCAEELKEFNFSDSQTVMCLDTEVMVNPCVRDIGAPVVLNAVLWGIVSSWQTSYCDKDSAGPSFVSLISAPNISSWIYATVRGIPWETKKSLQTMAAP